MKTNLEFYNHKNSFETGDIQKFHVIKTIKAERICQQIYSIIIAKEEDTWSCKHNSVSTEL